MAISGGAIEAAQVPSRTWSEHEKELLQEILGMSGEDVERLLSWVVQIRRPDKQTADAISNATAVPLRDI